MMFYCYCYFRLAQALASSFNFQGKVKKTFYVLSDDKVTLGPKVRAPAASAATEKDVVQAMETDNDVAPNRVQQPAVQPSLAAKLSASLALKRKATEPADQSGSTDRSKAKR